MEESSLEKKLQPEEERQDQQLVQNAENKHDDEEDLDDSVDLSSLHSLDDGELVDELLRGEEQDVATTAHLYPPGTTTGEEEEEADDSTPGSHDSVEFTGEEIAALFRDAVDVASGSPVGDHDGKQLQKELQVEQEILQRAIFQHENLTGSAETRQRLEVPSASSTVPSTPDSGDNQPASHQRAGATISAEAGTTNEQRQVVDQKMSSDDVGQTSTANATLRYRGANMKKNRGGNYRGHTTSSSDEKDRTMNGEKAEIMLESEKNLLYEALAADGTATGEPAAAVGGTTSGPHLVQPSSRFGSSSPPSSDLWSSSSSSNAAPTSSSNVGSTMSTGVDGGLTSTCTVSTTSATPLSSPGTGPTAASPSSSSRRQQLLAKFFARLPVDELQQIRAQFSAAETPGDKVRVLREMVALRLLSTTTMKTGKKLKGACKKRQNNFSSDAGAATGPQQTEEELQRKILLTKRRRKRDMIKKLLLKYSGDLELVKQVLEKREDPSYIKLWDKLSFTGGIMNLILVCYFIFGPHKFLLTPYLYTLQLCVLIPWRFWKYKRLKWVYFLLDFCYFGNLLLLLYLWVLPWSKLLFCVVFSASCGPMLLASTLFRNSLVFHSWEHCTSVFIHVVPFLCCYVIRHESASISEVSLFRKRALSFAQYDPEEVGWVELWVVPLLFYALQQVFSYFSSNYIWPIPEDPEYLNLYRWVVGTQTGQSILRKITVNTKWHEFWYFFLNFLVAAVSMLPCVFWYRSQYLMVVLGCVCITVNIWNGASFYVEVFSRKYQTFLKQKEELKQLREEKKLAGRGGVGVGVGVGGGATAMLQQTISRTVSGGTPSRTTSGDRTLVVGGVAGSSASPGGAAIMS
ncbi:unnamed protein product [Amoebophrya sp. A120]|nr:unnamed protein product [Amoebophrya sp. A120]|eukprot:GSA120T00011217001.1